MASTPLKIFYQNVRGLRTKTTEFYNNLLNLQSDLVLITESWLCEGILNSELTTDHYDVFRRDRKSLGGGVMILTNTGLNGFVREDWKCDDVECLWVTIPALSLGCNKDLHISITYLPPDSNLANLLNKYISFTSSILEKYSEDYFVLAGDFNLPLLSWTCNGSSCIKKGTVELQEAARNLIDQMSYFGFSQTNRVYNSRNNILDLLFCNFNAESTRSSSPLVSEDVFHPSIELDASDILSLKLQCAHVMRQLFNKGNYQEINKLLSDFDWSYLSTAANIDDAVEYFYMKLNNLIEKYIPKVSTKIKNKYPVWYSKSLIHIIKEKKEVAYTLETISKSL